jgi:DNA-binding NarL/FixJ family response regulator
LEVAPTVKVFVVDPHVIYRRGLTACLASVEEVVSVGEAGSVGDAWRDQALREADVVLLDPDLDGALEFIRQLHEVTGAKVVVCSTKRGEADVIAAVTAGAVGYLWKETLSPEALVGAIRAAMSGSGVMAPELLGTLLRSIHRAAAAPGPQPLTLSRLSTREQRVLQLLAEGHAIREVAERLSYSERTIKGVIHDAITKLNVRSRSQAVAMAVREGLI